MYVSSTLVTHVVLVLMILPSFWHQGDGPVWVPTTGPRLEGQILLIIPSGQSK
jgi:hypothetical protein